MVQNPEAAAVQLESQRTQAADAAYKLINQRNAEQVADFINQFEELMRKILMVKCLAYLNNVRAVCYLAVLPLMGVEHDACADVFLLVVMGDAHFH